MQSFNPIRYTNGVQVCVFPPEFDAKLHENVVANDVHVKPPDVTIVLTYNTTACVAEPTYDEKHNKAQNT